MAGVIPWPSGEALAALITQGGEAGRAALEEIRHGKLIIPAWCLGRKGKGKDAAAPIEIPASMVLASAGLLAAYWYFHSENNFKFFKDAVSSKALAPGAVTALYLGGPIGWALWQMAAADYGAIGRNIFGGGGGGGQDQAQGPASGGLGADTGGPYTLWVWHWNGKMWASIVNITGFGTLQDATDAAGLAYHKAGGDQWTVLNNVGVKVAQGVFE